MKISSGVFLAFLIACIHCGHAQEPPQTPTLTVNGSTTVESGTSLTLTCQTTSEGSITYTFLKDSTEVQGSSSNTYTVSNVSPEHSGTYTCVASNGAASSTSTDTYIFVLLVAVAKPDPPHITTNNNNPREGDSITLTCTSNTTGVNGYKWMLNGEEVNGQTSETYTIPEAHDGIHDGNYTCIAYINTVASDPSDELTVVICGGVLTESTGVITSPNYPQNYPNNLNCSWLIQGVAGQVVTLRVEDIELEASVGCGYDSLTLYDGDSTNATLLGKYCDTNPGNLTSSGPSMFIVFRSNDVVPVKGFKATYSLEGPPQTPTLTPKGSTTVESGTSSLTLTCQTTSEGSITYTFLKDDIEVQGSSSNTYTVSDPSPEHSGTYSCVASNGAGSSTSSDTYIFVVLVVVAKPDTPNITTNNNNPREGDSITLTCTSNTTGVNGYKWMLNGEEVNGQTSETYTIPEAHDGIHDGNYTCIAYINTVASDPSDELTVVICGEVLTESTGVITSPNYPQNYPPNRHCSWLIQGVAGQVVTLRVEDIDLENINNCLYDSLTLYDGDSTNAALLGKYCGTNPGTVTSSGPSMFIVFISDEIINQKGFNATYFLEAAAPP